MKKMIFVAWCFALLSLVGCTKTLSENNQEEDLYENSPNSPVPSELATGSWFYGTLSAISYWDRDGHQLGHDYEAGREFQFSNYNGQGRLKFWQYLGTRNSASCVAEYFTYKEGTVQFEGDLFTFYPVKGSFKTIRKDCSSNNGVSERKAVADDLKPVSYRWEIRNINGHPHLYTYDETDQEREDPVFVYSFTH